MRMHVDIQGRNDARPPAVEFRPALAFIATLLLMGGFGCGSHHAEHTSAERTSAAGPSSETPSQDQAKAKAAVITGGQETIAPREQGRPGGAIHRIRLSEKGCVQFEPQWTTVTVGHSLTWQSDLRTAVTIHVSSGAFDKTAYVVRPGASVTTGPARAPGSYSIITEPTACRDAPRGARGAGPGVMIEEPAPH
jgi:plastocyanin